MPIFTLLPIEHYRRSLILFLFAIVLSGCGGGGGGGGTTTTPTTPTIPTTPTNTAPIANAGADQAVTTGDTVSLSGAQSSDADGNSLTYTWLLSSVPASSAASLDSTSAAQTSFVADVDGTYVASLVVNDGTVNSTADTITIVATGGQTNTLPIANAGVDQAVTTNDTVALDGLLSSDADDDDLTYSWNLSTVPAGSLASLMSNSSAQTSFVADVGGIYVATLMVNDGTDNSVADSVTITANTLPVANGGADQAVATNATVNLSGAQSSDADGDDLTYLWSLSSVPEGSGTSLSSTTQAQSSFVADIKGTYVASLIVNDGTADSATYNVTINANTTPVANGGVDQAVNTNDTVSLSGAQSSDADADNLTYLWSLSTVPEGSEATLSSSTEQQTSFVADIGGTYIASLIVNDGTADSAAYNVTIMANTVPTANAGNDQAVTTNDTVNLSGVQSSDAEGDTLSYTWTLSTVPDGSGASLSATTTVQTSFVADVSGTYVASLIVNDGIADSNAHNITITASVDQTNTAPVANAGDDQAVTINDTVSLSGSQSIDVDGDNLSYLWSLTTVPDGSEVSLSSTITEQTSFIPDIGGSYVISLMVNDGSVNSAVDNVTITANTLPVANAGDDQSITTSDTVTLTGSQSSDADGDSLTYSWSLTTLPSGSAASLTSTNSEQTSFVADVGGTYIASLTVNDGTGDSTTDTVTITANTIPIANAGADQAVNAGNTVALSGSLSSDADDDTLSYSWSLSTVPSGSAASLSSTSSVETDFVADIGGTYVASLMVNDGTDNSVADTITITANTLPVANAGDDQTVDIASTVSLSGSQSSDADGDDLSYSWSLSTVPDGSAASLSSISTEQSTFVADIAGTYVVSLVVNDGQTDSSADSVNITASAAADFYTPAPIVEVLQLNRTVTWTALATTPADLTRFTMGEDGSTDILALTDTDSSVDASLSVMSGLTEQSSVTDEVLLRTMFKFIELTDGTFRIVSTKHSNYVLDIDDQGVTDALILRDYRSGSLDSASAGYLAFSVTGTSPMVLSATGRKVYNSTTGDFDDDADWVTKAVELNSGVLTLTTGTGTSMALYMPPINFDMPFDFNPDGTSRVSNAEVTPETKGSDPVATTGSQVVSTYADQVTAMGADDSTTEATVAMIAAIEVSLASEGAQIRYPAEFYTTFRAGLFARTLQSSDSTDGVIGQLTVPYVYFTNETDGDGVHHPFMVIASYGVPDSLALLWDVAKPPGDGESAEYADQAVTRSYHIEAFLMKIPMRDYGEVASLTENTMANDLASDVGVTDFDHHNYASTSATGVAVDGVVIYPSYNNSLHVSQSAAELSAHGMHSGRGLGVHYHADAHSATGEGLNLYNTTDYVGHTHPPIVSMGFDGVAGYGVYQQGDSTSEGVDIALDDFGGHEHGVYAYHYHSMAEAEVTPTGAGPDDPAGGVSYTAHKLPPLGAWSGRINDIPEFWDGTAPNYVGGKSVYLGTE